MYQIGQRTFPFRAPALIDRQLTYLSSTQFAGRWTALCFLPYVGIVEPDWLDDQAGRLDRIGTTLLIVSSGTRPLHRVWLDRQQPAHTPLLYDPLARLHRAFGVPPAQMPARCRTFLIDPARIVRFHLVHDFTDRGLDALHEIVTLSHAQDAGREADRDIITSTREEVLKS